MLSPSKAPTNDFDSNFLGVAAEESGVGAYLAARYARKNLDYSSAADYFIKTFEQDSNNQVILNNIYMLLVYAGRIDDAYPYALKAMGEEPYTSSACIVAVVKNIADGDYVKAEELISKIDKKGYNKFLVPLVKSWLQFAQNKVDEAFKTLGTLKDDYDYNSVYHFHMGIMNDILGRDDVAKEHYEITLNGPGGSSFRALDVIICFMLRTHNIAKAEEILQKYSHNYPDSFMLEKIIEHIKSGEPYDRPIYDAKTGTAEVLFGVAALLTQGVGLEHSMFFIRLAMHLDDQFVIAKIMLGNILELGELYEQANAVYDTIPKSSAAWFSAQINIASNLNKMEKVSEAISILRMLEQQDPENADVNIEMGDLLRGKERYREAIEPYTKALAIFKSKKEPEAKYWSLYYARAICYERSNQWKKAERDLVKALEVEPNQPYVLNYLAYSWLERREKVPQALEMLKVSYMQRPRDGFIADSLGWAFCLIGDYSQAIDYLETAASLEPSNSVIIDHLGDAYWRGNRKKEAKYQWERALTLNNDITKGDLEKIKVKIIDGLPELTYDEEDFISQFEHSSEKSEIIENKDNLTNNEKMLSKPE
ncbi:MAG: hypothetical protein AB7U85_02510 [Alphaproteobacteria bacterium]